MSICGASCKRQSNTTGRAGSNHTQQSWTLPQHSLWPRSEAFGRIPGHTHPAPMKARPTSPESRHLQRAEVCESNRAHRAHLGPDGQKPPIRNRSVWEPSNISDVRSARRPCGYNPGRKCTTPIKHLRQKRADDTHLGLAVRRNRAPPSWAGDVLVR